jgi:hypothetical protein
MREMATVDQPDAPPTGNRWHRCRSDKNLRWFLEGVLRPGILGRALLLSTRDLFCQLEPRLDATLSLQFRVTGLPFLSHSLARVDADFQRAMHNGDVVPERAQVAKQALGSLLTMQGRSLQDHFAAALLNTIRSNEVLRSLVRSDDAVTEVQLRRDIPNYEALDWSAMKDSGDLFAPLLRRSASKKLVNRFTLNFNTLAEHVQPDALEEFVIYQSARYFVGLLRKRRVTETAWRSLLFELFDRALIVPCTRLFFFCRRCPDGGFVTSTSLSFALPPKCPYCSRPATAVACFFPDGSLREAISTKDGILGTAIGWHLTKTGLPFRHAYEVCGTECDFVIEASSGIWLIEAKMLQISGSRAQLARNLRDSLTQLVEHATLLVGNGKTVVKTACVVNLSHYELSQLGRTGALLGPYAHHLVSYDRFPQWVARAKSSRGE